MSTFSLEQFHDEKISRRKKTQLDHYYMITYYMLYMFLLADVFDYFIAVTELIFYSLDIRQYY